MNESLFIHNSSLTVEFECMLHYSSGKMDNTMNARHLRRCLHLVFLIVHLYLQYEALMTESFQ